MTELWQKMRDVQIQTNHTNIYNIALERIRKYYGKNDITKEEKEK